ncbi:MAG: IclR family transcriptional regulator [Nocardioides sp.]|uniref:IclR family transcriptional regulator n=1 Tax=Nocardioides sp. TaxID=35761 RepID=UPI0039E43B89
MTTTAVAKPEPSMVTRMTAILDTFDRSYRCRSLQDISELTGLPRSTAHRILEQLVSLGWIQHNISGYRLGWRANRLPSRADEDARLREAAAPHLHDLVMKTRVTVHLAVLEGPMVRYLDKVGVSTSSVPSRVGGSLPAHLTAVGKAMLAQLDPEALDEALQRLHSHSDVTTVDWARMHRELATVRMRGGLAVSLNSKLAPVACIGAPVLDRDGRIVGGLSICDGGAGAPLDKFVPLLLEHARRISAQHDEIRRRDDESLIDEAPRPDWSALSAGAPPRTSPNGRALAPWADDEHLRATPGPRTQA